MLIQDTQIMVNSPVNLLQATKEQRQLFLDSFDYILTDCDGTVWQMNKPYEGVDRAIAELKEKGKRIVFVSNNATRTEESYDINFKSYKFDATFVSVTILNELLLFIYI